ncbi:MAG TPA: hypothetical protein VFB79_22590, partial [Candidatus Angelobacter sp.]|nr:hypothetical protein [Candidatus Angelobacter sp.]
TAVRAKKLKFTYLAERFGPLAIGIISGIGLFWVPALRVLKAPWRGFMLDKVLDVEIGILAGLLAVVAFLPAIEDKTVIRKFKQWGYYRFLIGYLAEAIILAAAVIVLGLAIIVFPESWNSHYRVDRIISAIWWGCIIYSFATCYRIIKISLKTLLAK